MLQHTKNKQHKPGTSPLPQRPDSIVARTVMPQNQPQGQGQEHDEPILIDFLQQALGAKRSTAKTWLKYGQVKVNGTITEAFDAPLPAGTLVEVNTSRPWQTLNHPRLKLVYEDDDIIVVNKGYGLLSVAGEGAKTETAYSILRDYVKRVDPRQKIFIVHRLDQHTSGLMMFAKTQQAKEAMQHNWNNMVLDRRYAAVVEGTPAQPQGTVDTLLAENSQHVVYVAAEPTPDSRRAVTRYSVVRQRGGYSLLDVSLDTGRKNQIRVHLQHLGTPIAGDKKYGAKSSPAHRLCLHARTLRFAHPITRRDMNFTLPLPAAFNKIV